MTRAALLTLSLDLREASSVRLLSSRVDASVEDFTILREAPEDASIYTIFFVHGEAGMKAEVSKIKAAPKTIFVYGGGVRHFTVKALETAFPLSVVFEGSTPEDAFLTYK